MFPVNNFCISSSTGDETASMFLVTTATALECEDDSDSEDVWF